MNETDSTQPVSHTQTALDRAADFDATDGVEFRGVIHGDTIEVALRHLEGVVDEARLQFTPHGLYAAAVEEDNVTMNRLFAHAFEWDEYELATAGVVAVDVAALGKTLRGLKTRKRDSDLLCFDVKENAGGETVFTVTDSEATTEDVPVFPTESVRTAPDMPELTFSASVTVANANEVREWVKGLPTSGVVSVTASVGSRGEAAFSFEHKKNVSDSKNPADAEYVLEDAYVVDALDEVDVNGKRGAYDEELAGDAVDAHMGNHERIRGTFTASYLKAWAKRLRKTRTENVPYTFQFGEEWPLEITRSDGSKVVSETLLAPRVNVA